MSLPVIVHGTLQPDGTLTLDQKLNLPPGEVLVTVQPAAPTAPTKRGLADVIDEIRRGQQARNFQGRSAEDIEAARNEGEAEYEQRTQALRAQNDSSSTAGGS
jgi:hypothetical protein